MVKHKTHKKHAPGLCAGAAMKKHNPERQGYAEVNFKHKEI